MKLVLKRLILGVLLIVAASAALLLSDLGRRTMKAHSLPRLGLLQHASTMLLDEGTRGTIDALAEHGFVDGKSIVIEQFNAHGDIAVGNSIAAEMVAARYDLLVTMSTLSLQAVANANRGGKTVQVFGLVADPAVAGVGISWEDPLKHPANLVGYGSFLPVPDAFKVAREMFPGLSAWAWHGIRRKQTRGRLSKRPANTANRSASNSSKPTSRIRMRCWSRRNRWWR